MGGLFKAAPYGCGSFTRHASVLLSQGCLIISIFRQGFLVLSSNEPPALGKRNRFRLNSIKRPTGFLEFHQTTLQEIRLLGKA
jgi:hypothetical protein